MQNITWWRQWTEQGFKWGDNPGDSAVIMQRTMKSISTASICLILLLFCAGLAGCGKTGVDDPLVWFQKNKDRLATIVQDLARTEIREVQPEERIVR